MLDRSQAPQAANNSPIDLLRMKPRSVKRRKASSVRGSASRPIAMSTTNQAMTGRRLPKLEGRTFALEELEAAE